jgi:hypothetical protein
MRSGNSEDPRLLSLLGSIIRAIDLLAGHTLEDNVGAPNATMIQSRLGDASGVAWNQMPHLEKPSASN